MLASILPGDGVQLSSLVFSPHQNGATSGGPAPESFRDDMAPSFLGGVLGVGGLFLEPRLHSTLRVLSIVYCTVILNTYYNF